jgi:hypothetical protein
MTERPRGIPTFEMKRPLRVHGLRALLTIGFQEDRPELRALVTLGAQRGGHLDVASVQKALLPTLPKIVARRFLEGAVWCGLFKSVEGDRFALTELGMRAQTEPVFVPQEGLWTIWVTDDPMVPPDRRVLRLEPYMRPRSDREERTSKIPAGVLEALGAEAQAAWSRPLGRFRVALDHERVTSDCVVIEARSRVTLTVRVSASAGVEVALEGLIEGDDDQAGDASHEIATTRFQHPDRTADEIWRTALGPNAGEWEAEQLGAAFDELDDHARRTFRRPIRFSSWRDPALGTFGPFDVPAVPLRPRAQSDADAWARWLLERRVDEYGTATAWARWTEAVRKDLPEFSLGLPSQLELARSLHRGGRTPDPSAYWHLVAPLDLQPATRSAT